MTLHPTIIALVVLSAAIGGLLVYACYWAARILWSWDLGSGEHAQLDLERRTYLVSTLVAYGLAFQLVSVFLFVLAADQLTPLFTGAMCAAGTLNVNELGYPVLALKVMTCVAAGVWLVVNHTDVAGWDYPLVRQKYSALLALTPFVLVEAVLQAGYFLSLRPDVITSCCGSLFSSGRGGLAGGLASLPVRPTQVAFFGTLGFAILACAAFVWLGRGAYLVAVSAGLALPVAVAAIVSFVSPYVYELPTHRCPFCLLQREYAYVGYLWYGALLAASVTGLGVGAIQPFTRLASLVGVAPRVQRRLAAVTGGLLAIVSVTVVWRIATSHLRM
jgi:hypothetical protein